MSTTGAWLFGQLDAAIIGGEGETAPALHLLADAVLQLTFVNTDNAKTKPLLI